jgi:predicted nucleotidyltransferase
MTSLSELQKSAQLADELVSDTLHFLEGQGVHEVRARLPLKVEAEPLRSVEVDRLAVAIFERARVCGARAVLIADSYARGYADAESDLDIRLIVDAEPGIRDRQAFIERLADAGCIRQYGDEAYITADQFTVERRRVDVRYHPISWLERALSEPFVLGGPIDLLELLETNRVVADPSGIAVRLCLEHRTRRQRAREVALESIAALRPWRETRADAANPAEIMARAMGPGLEYIVRVWAGANERILAFPKWTHHILPSLTLCPRDGLGLLQSLATNPWHEGRTTERLREWAHLTDALALLVRRV